MKSIRAKSEGCERECFSPRGKRWLAWHRGERAHIKHRFWRKIRAQARSKATKD